MSFSEENTNRQEQIEIIPPQDDCPGRFKCHGPAGWCDKCGDVDLVCDDPECMVHLRGSERLLNWSNADFELREAEAEFRGKKQAEREASQIADPEDYGEGDEDIEISITEWLAGQKGLL